jgi:hypothetical protein
MQRARDTQRGAATTRVLSAISRATTHPGSLRAEALGVAVIYGTYEISRGLLTGDASTAIRHADDITRLERSLHLFIEPELQNVARAIPGMLRLFGVLYLTLHLGLTGLCLFWLYRRRPSAFAFVRTTLLIATVISLVIFALYPTAPPRMAGVGIADTVSGAHFDLNHGLVKLFYNPFAAVPSLHFGYALIVGLSAARQVRSRLARLAAGGYPALVLAIIVTTGNHFIVDAVAGALVAGAAALSAAALLESYPRVPRDGECHRGRDRAENITAVSTMRLPASDQRSTDVAGDVTDLQLFETTPFASGIVIHSYRPTQPAIREHDIPRSALP